VLHTLWYRKPGLVPLSHPSLFSSGFLPHEKVGAPIAGRASDLMIKKWRKKRAGKWVAEDRLRAALFGAIGLLPLSVAFFGVANAYLDGTWGLVVCFVCLFVTGIGVSFQRLRNREEQNKSMFDVGGVSSDRGKPS